jgi:hypothetical protein
MAKKICPRWEECEKYCKHASFHNEIDGCIDRPYASCPSKCSNAADSAEEIEPYIGVDLDGTLAEYHGWQGPEHIGPVIQPMFDRIKTWLAEGKKVKIFTARACIPEQIPPIKAWLKFVGLGDLEVTCVKDFGMVELWDDRCVCVKINTGDYVRYLEGERKASYNED